VIIDLLRGVDMFYFDSLLIQTVGDNTRYVDSLAQEYEQAIAHFEARVETIPDMESYLHVLSQLAQAQFE
jgi:hypothetical protein